MFSLMICQMVRFLSYNTFNTSLPIFSLADLCTIMIMIWIGFAVFFDAPHHVGAEQGGSPDNNHSLGWWFSREDDYYKAIDYSEIDKGFSESLEHFCKFYKEQVIKLK